MRTEIVELLEKRRRGAPSRYSLVIRASDKTYVPRNEVLHQDSIEFVDDDYGRVVLPFSDIDAVELDDASEYDPPPSMLDGLGNVIRFPKKRDS
jgi:hypothetical protein